MAVVVAKKSTALSRLTRSTVSFMPGSSRRLPRPAADAAGDIHSDGERGFHRRRVIPWDKLVEAGGWARAKERGWVRLEGKDYEVQDGDVIYVLFNA